MTERKFKKSFDEALMQGYVFHGLFLEDLTAFSDFSASFADPFAADFLAEIQAADDFPTIENDRAEQGIYGSAVDGAMANGRAQFQKLIFHVEDAFPDNEAVLKLFGADDYDAARKSVLKMINLLQAAYKTAMKPAYNAQLLAVGFTAPEIDKLKNFADDLLVKNQDYEEYQRKTFSRTEDKVNAFNTMWDRMAKISDASKLIFRESPARVQMYLLYPDTGQHRPPAAPENMTYNFDTGIFSWDEVETATSYQLMYRAGGSSDTWEEGWAGEETICDFFPGAGSWECRVRARNDGGYGDFSPAITVELQDVLLPPSWVYAHYSGAPVVSGDDPAPKVEQNNVEVTWAESARAELYEIWRSITPINDPPGTFSKIVETSSRRYLDYEVAAQTRHYYYIIATAGEQRSEPSVQAMAEILQV